MKCLLKGEPHTRQGVTPLPNFLDKKHVVIFLESSFELILNYLNIYNYSSLFLIKNSILVNNNQYNCSLKFLENLIYNCYIQKQHLTTCEKKKVSTLDDCSIKAIFRPSHIQQKSGLSCGNLFHEFIWKGAFSLKRT